MTGEDSKAKWNRHYFNERDSGSAYESVSYTHLTLPTKREV